MKFLPLLLLLPFIAGCTVTDSSIPVNLCVLAQCEQQADTGGGTLSEGSQDAAVDVGL